MRHPTLIDTRKSAVYTVLYPVAWKAGYVSTGNVPTNAVYANGKPIPNPLGSGYLVYGAVV